MLEIATNLVFSFFDFAMNNPEHDSSRFSAENPSSGDTPDLSRRGFLQALGALGVTAGVGSLIAPQRLEAAEKLGPIDWPEILRQFGDSVVIPGERDASGKDMIVGRTMNEIYALYVQQQKDWCAEDAAYCEGETPHARRDNRVLVPSDYILSVPIPRAGQSVTSRDADKIPSIYLPLNGYATTQNIADFSGYANEILGLSGKYSDLQMVGENGESRSLLMSKQGVPIFFSAEELLFIYAHYRMNKVTAEEIQFAGTVLDYGGVNSAAQARNLRYSRIGKVRWAGMNNLQKALEIMFAIHRQVNETNDQSIDSSAPSENWHTMQQYWSTDFYGRGNNSNTPKIQTQARIRAMLAKDPEPLGNTGKNMLNWWSSAEFVPPTLTDAHGNKFSAENPIDFVNKVADNYFANDPERDLKAIMLLSNLQLKDLLDYNLRELYGGEGKREDLQTTKTLEESESAQFFRGGIGAPRKFLVEESPATTIAQN